MSTTTTLLCQFFSGVLVGAALCLCIFTTGWYNFGTIKIGVPLEEVEVSYLMRIFGNTRTISHTKNETKIGNMIGKEERPNKTIITCIVPLLGDLDRFDQLESGIIATWIKSCGHVVFLRKVKSPKSYNDTENSLQKLQYRSQTKNKMSVSYFYVHENVTEIDGNNSFKYGSAAKTGNNASEPVSWLGTQFKAIEFAFKKYTDTNIFILTSTVEDIIKYFYQHVNANSSNNNNNELENKLQNVLRSSHSFDQTVFTLDECLVLGRKAVSKLIKMTHMNVCTFKDQHLLSEWAVKCIQNY